MITLNCSSPEEQKEYERMSKIYPVYIDGKWFMPEDIDMVESDWLKQKFFNQIVYTFLYNMQCYFNPNNYNVIQKNYHNLTKAIDFLKRLSGRADYVERTKQAFLHSCLNESDGQNSLIFKTALNPDSIDKVINERTMELLNNKIQKEEDILSNYKRKCDYKKRLGHLIEEFEELQALKVYCIQEAVERQTELYRKRLDLATNS